MADFDLRQYYNATKTELEALRPYWEVEMVKFRDNIVEFGDVKKETIVSVDDDGNQLVRHERFDGAVFQEGTPLTAENLGRMDMNIYMIYLWIKWLMERMNYLEIQMATVLRQNSNNMPANGFFADAKNINVDMIIIEGWYDEMNGRGVV